jgi:hypothetical protein
MHNRETPRPEEDHEDLSAPLRPDQDNQRINDILGKIRVDKSVINPEGQSKIFEALPQEDTNSAVRRAILFQRKRGTPIEFHITVKKTTLKITVSAGDSFASLLSKVEKAKE